MDISGLLLIDKPAGLTSHDVVARVRRILGTRRVGHTGTLDPFATGLMVLPIGSATRLAQFLDKDRKEYIAGIKFGFETDTGDLMGQPVSAERLAFVDRDELEGALQPLRGPIDQVPPMFSAKKVGGQKLYELARKGETIERKAVPVTVYELEVIHDALVTPHCQYKLRIACSAGTYVRSLAVEIGRLLGIGAHLTSLVRTAAGRFSLGDALTLEELASAARPEDLVLPSIAAVQHLSECRLAAERLDKTRNGLSTRIEDAGFDDGSFVRLSDESGALIAIGKYDSSTGVVQPKVVLS